MIVDFFKASCHDATSESKFGICDDENNKPVYIDISDEEKWLATIINDFAKKIEFTAVDNCIDIFREDGEMDNRCEAILYYESNLLFLELKNKRGSWKTEGLNQIESVIKHMISDENNFYSGFRKRKAVVANVIHSFPGFQVYDTDQREYFFKEYKARIQFESTIVIK